MNVEKVQSSIGMTVALVLLGTPLLYAAWLFFSVILFQPRAYP